jgi:multidrug efflux pump subunit AcrA (membrane-fusion protein)
VQVGQRAEIRCDAFPGQAFFGRVTHISGGLGKKKIQTDNPTEKIDTDILETFIEVDPGSPLRVGLRVDVYVQLARKNNVLIVPRRAVEFSDGVATVHVESPTGPGPQSVRLGAQDGVNVEIVAGLQEGDLVAY